MTERYAPSGPSYASPYPHEIPHDTTENNIIYGNFQPDLNRRKAMRHIGKIATAITVWQTDENGIARKAELQKGDVLSSELIELREDPGGKITTLFKQYRLGFRGDGSGLIHPKGIEGLETVSILHAVWDPQTQTVESGDVHARNFRYILPGHEAKKQSKAGQKELAAWRQELADSLSGTDMPIEELAAD